MSMEENPYEAPRSPTRAPVGGKKKQSKEVREVAVYQKGILICIAIYLAAVLINLVVNVGKVPVPSFVPVAVAGVALINILVGVVFVFLLSMKLYHPVVGVLMSVLALVPCIGLLILLLISTKATAMLQENGYTVGLLGANLNEIPK
jgi:hypothetical protein